MLFIADYDIMIHVFLVVLSSFVDKDIACQAVKSGGIMEEEVECRPEKAHILHWMRMSILDWFASTSHMLGLLLKV